MKKLVLVALLATAACGDRADKIAHRHRDNQADDLQFITGVDMTNKSGSVCPHGWVLDTKNRVCYAVGTTYYSIENESDLRPINRIPRKIRCLIAGKAVDPERMADGSYACPNTVVTTNGQRGGITAGSVGEVNVK